MDEVHEWHVSLTKLWVLDHWKVGQQVFQSRQQTGQRFKLPAASCQGGTQEGDPFPHVSSFPALLVWCF